MSGSTEDVLNGLLENSSKEDFSKSDPESNELEYSSIDSSFGDDSERSLFSKNTRRRLGCNKLIFSFVLVVVVIFLVFYFAVASLVLWFHVFSVEPEHYISQVEDEIYEYKFLTVDHETKRSKSGFITIAQQLSSEDDFIFSQDESGMTLISTLEAEEFECTGSCSCDTVEEQSRKNAVNVIKSGLKYLAAGTASFVALQHARDHFQEECVRYESEGKISCPSLSRVVSSVEGCETLDQPAVEDIPISTPEPAPRNLKYFCKGKCIPMVKHSLRPFVRENLKLNELAKKFGCEKYTKEIEVSILDLRYRGLTKEMGRQKIVSHKFMEIELHPYCQEAGVDESTDNPLCSGGVSEGLDLPRNPTVKCVRLRTYYDD